jgi:alpha-N-arabinofuranosidase
MTIRYALDLSQSGPIVKPEVYGHFAEHLGRGIYEGLWVGEDSSIPNTRGLRNDVVAALKQLNIPVLRWPGGCFADEYHWMDGIGPREQRPALINTHWGGVVENNHFGTHEFFDLCEMLGAAPYVCGNVGSGTVREMMEWVEYMTSAADSPLANRRRANGRHEPWQLPYFGVGNESWGCGGNMRPEYYADEYRRFNTFVKNYSDNRIYRIACGANSEDYHWTEVLMERAGKLLDGLSLHYYTLEDGWPPKGSATSFSAAQWDSIVKSAGRMDDLLARHGAIMDRHDPDAKVGLIVDEWGTWFEPETGSTPGFLYQQNSMRDAVVAALTLHIFHRHASRVAMANIAQMVNVLQAMVLTDGPRMLLTPTYWIFEMLKSHQGGRVLSLPDDERISCAATTAGDVATISFANISATEAFDIEIDSPFAEISGRLLAGESMTAYNDFDHPDRVTPSELPVQVRNRAASFSLPPHSVGSLQCRLG